MVLPFSPRRRRQAVASAILIVGLLGLFNHYSLLHRNTLKRAVDKTCANAVARLEQLPVTWPVKPVPGDPLGSDIIESLNSLNEFEMCVLHNNNLEKHQIAAVETRLFPYLDLETLNAAKKDFWPVRVRWNGDLLTDSVPRFASVGDYEYLGALEIEYVNGVSFWGNWLKVLSESGSKGIVIAAGIGQVSDAAKLIKVLRHQRNALPLEIVHRGDLSVEHQKMLIDIARSAPSTLSPAQELWFVNVTSVLSPKHAQQFTTFSNKWLALIFSSFENAILMDADTVPFVPMETYFDSQQHKMTGQLFFKDRAITSDLLNDEQLETLRNVASSVLGFNCTVEELGAEIDRMIEDDTAAEAAKRMLIDGHKHHMESGLVVINKSRHLVNLLTSVSLQFSSISDYFHGDKEWFWIAQFFRNNTFSFHPKAASNVGGLGKVNSGDGREFYQICSVQVSHTEVDGSLSWVNGGLRTCKKDSWTADYELNGRISSMFQSEEEVKRYYLSPAYLEGAIIPSVEKAPWIHSGECAMFSFCTLYKEGEYGELIKFSDSQKKSYQEVVKIWNSNT